VSQCILTDKYKLRLIIVAVGLLRRDMLLRDILKKIWVLNLALIVVLAAAFYLLLTKDTKEEIEERIGRKLQVITKAQAANLSSFFEIFGGELTVISQSPSVESGKKEAEQILSAFVNQWKDSGLIGGLIFVNKSGNVVYNSNVSGVADVGGDVSDRDYFKWAKNQAEIGEYFVGTPVVSRLGATKGRVIVPVASPVFKDGLFVGLIAASIDLENLVQNFLGKMEVSSLTTTILKDANGKVLYGSENDQLNLVLVQKEKISVGGLTWELMVGSPVEELKMIVAPIYMRQLAVFVLIIFGMVAYVSFLMKTKNAY